MKLSKSTSYAINWLYANGSSIDKISEELNITPESVKTYIEKNNIQEHDTLATKSSPVKSSKDLMITHTKNKNTNNVAIMTKEASEFNDHAKKKLNNTTSNKKQGYIFKPNK